MTGNQDSRWGPKIKKYSDAFFACSMENQLSNNLVEIGGDIWMGAYTFDNTPIPTATTTKDLGVLLQNNLNTWSHCEKVTGTRMKKRWKLRCSIQIVWNSPVLFSTKIQSGWLPLERAHWRLYKNIVAIASVFTQETTWSNWSVIPELQTKPREPNCLLLYTEGFSWGWSSKLV